MTRSDAQTIVVATAADVDALVPVMIDAFLHTPDCVWLIPDTAARRDVFTRYVPRLLRYALTAGHVDTTAARDAAAVWWEHGSLDPDALGAIVADTCHPHTAAFGQLGAILADAFTATGWSGSGPFDALAYLGVAPGRQNQGIGSALLRHRLAQLDTAGTASYLVASSTGSRDLYERHGYRTSVAGPVRLPGDGPLLWPMWRNAATNGGRL